MVPPFLPHIFPNIRIGLSHVNTNKINLLYNACNASVITSNIPAVLLKQYLCYHICVCMEDSKECCNKYHGIYFMIGALICKYYTFLMVYWKACGTTLIVEGIYIRGVKV